jgi:hypothetical protein
VKNNNKIPYSLCWRIEQINKHTHSRQLVCFPN